MSVGLFLPSPRDAGSLQGLSGSQRWFEGKCFNNSGCCHQNVSLHMHSTLSIKIRVITPKLAGLPKKPALDVMQIESAAW